MVSSLLLIYLDCPKLGIQSKQTPLNFKLLIQRYAQFCFLDKSPEIFCPSHFVNDFSRKMFLLYDQISSSDSRYFWICRAICILKLFVSQAVISENLKLT